MMDAAREAFSPDAARSELSGWRRWAFPLIAVAIIPAMVLASLEAGLRLCGYGYPAEFFVAVEGADAVTTNPRFGWRFFPRTLARTPQVCYLSAHKPALSYRIFVLGGSAAMGTPDASFGFGRMLELMLRESYPEAEFQVINTAMTAINSHVMLTIGRECAAYRPDLFLVYLGNNEVVGPWGPGSVLKSGSPPRGLIRLGIRAKALRLGQLLDRLLVGVSRGAEGPGEWKGMEMFLERRVARDDPRLDRVYADFRENLTDLTRTAARAGAEVVLSTVASNLRDCPPFASLHRDDLTAAELARWQESYARAGVLRDRGAHAEAVVALREALGIDDRFAELHFRLASSSLELAQLEPARRHFTLARDLDTLRFRADSRINRMIREVAAEGASEGIHLVDGERILAAAPETRDGLLGNELFYEHVHLNFHGNYRLARAFFDRVEDLLPARIRARAPRRAPPTLERCAELLAHTDWDRYRMAASIVAMTRRPPFTHQLGHAARIRARRHELARLRRRSREGIEQSERIYRAALARAGEDLRLRVKFASLLMDRRKFAEAAEQWRTLTERVPGIVEWHTQLGFALADQGQIEQAVAELRRAVALMPRSAPAYVNLGTVVEKQGDSEAAAALYRKARELDPRLLRARFNLGVLLEKEGKYAAAAEQYRQALGIDPASAEARFRLGGALERQDDFAGAVDAYARAVELDPDLAMAHNNLGYIRERQGRSAEAIAAYRRALAADPELALAHFNLADVLLAQGRAGEAAASYRSGLRLEPGNQQAHRNLALALQIEKSTRSPEGGSG